MNIIAGLKAAAKAFSAEPKAESFCAGGKPIKCVQCEGILFYKRRFTLGTFANNITNTEWAERRATGLVCANCSRIEWYFDDLQADKQT